MNAIFLRGFMAPIDQRALKLILAGTFSSSNDNKIQDGMPGGEYASNIPRDPRSKTHAVQEYDFIATIGVRH
jgi:hypothetical protein